MDFARSYQNVTFRYEWEDSCSDMTQFHSLVEKARLNLWRMQERLNWFMDYNFVFNIDDRLYYQFNFSTNSIKTIDGDELAVMENYLEAKLSIQLMYSIITGKVHWNNAEGGLHIDFYRKPNAFIPEVYTIMSFLRPKSSCNH